MNRLLTFLLMLTVALAAAAREYDVQDFYEVQPVERGTIAIVNYNDVEEVKTLLVPSAPRQGKFVVTVTRLSKDLYRVDGTDMVVRTRYCYEYATREEVVLVVSSRYGYTKGKLIFD